MKTNLSKMMWVLLCVGFIILCANPAVLAVEPLELHMESVVAGDNQLQIYLNTNAEPIPAAKDFTVTLGNTPLTIWNLKSAADAKTSYVFLVDISGSIRQSHLQAIKDTIGQICAELSDKDNISVFAIGDNVYTQPFVSGMKAMQAQIDAIAGSREDTNLYKSIYTSLAILNTHEHAHDKKALVIFSDGEEDIFDGITFDEVAARVGDSRIPIYTIATLGTNPPSRYVESAKVLGSFARASAGGQHYIHTLTPAMSEEIAGDILASVRNGLFMAVDLTDFQSDGQDKMLRLELTVANMGKAGVGHLISTVGLSYVAEEVEEAAEEEAAEAEEPAEDATVAETDNGDGEDGEWEPADTWMEQWLYWIIGGAAVGLIGLIVIIFALTQKRKPAEAAPSPMPGTIAPPIPPPAAPMQGPPPRPDRRAASPQPPPGKPKIALRLTKVGMAEEQVFRAEFAGELTIGRSPARAMLPFREDERLSALHCVLSYDPEGVVLRDAGSTNGTYVNGVPIQGRHLLENDDVLLIGAMELRVNWENIN